MHVRISSWDPEMIQIQVFEPPGINVGERRQKDIEKFYGRQDFRRAFYSEFGEIEFPTGPWRPTCAASRATWTWSASAAAPTAS